MPSDPLNEVEKQQIVDFYMTKLGVPYKTQLAQFNDMDGLDFTPSYYQFVSTIREWQNSDGFAAWLFGSYFYLFETVVEIDPVAAFKVTARMLEKFIVKNIKHEVSGTVTHTASMELVKLLGERFALKRNDDPIPN